MARPRLKTQVIPPHRLLTLADGVFAIVMTILVLELGIPIILGTSVNTELTHELLGMWPEFLVYGLSFLVVGVFWLMHHFIFDNVKQYDAALSWINIFFLMCTSLLPFSTALFGEYGAITIIAVAYGVNMFLGFLGLVSLWIYSTRKGLVSSDVESSVVKGGILMGIVYLVTTLVGVGVAFVNPIISFILYFLIVAVVVTLTAMGKVELVVMLPVSTQQTEKINITDGD
jgi:uncharacterized membrane protein